KEPASEEIVQVNEAAIKKLLGEIVPAGDDALTQALLALAEAQDNVRSRSAYLAGVVAEDVMPRYRSLKLVQLQALQKEVEALARERILPLLAKSEHQARIKPWLEAIHEQALLVQQLLDSGQPSEASRDLQSNIVEASRDLTQFIARVKQIRDLAVEHSR